MRPTIQQRFSHSKAWKRAAREYFRSEGITGDVSFLLEITQEIIEALSDNQIREVCSMMLEASDIRPTEREQLLYLLCRQSQ